MKCKNCKYWDIKWEDTEMKPCDHPLMDKDEGDKNLINYGGSDGDGDGDYFRTDGNFGCILWEAA